MKVRILLVCLSLAAAWKTSPSSAEEPKCNTQRWEKAIARFTTADQTDTPAHGGIVFVGSSSIVGWKLPEFFPELRPINRGFGGSQICHSTHFLQQLVLKHRPRVVVFYAGDNDVAAGKSAERVHRDFAAFWARLHKALPETRLVYIAIKPSILRWKMAETMQEANRRIADDCKKDVRLTYIDVWQPMLGEDGQPRQELFRKDGLHLNHTGYELWTELVRPALEANSEVGS